MRRAERVKNLEDKQRDSTFSKYRKIGIPIQVIGEPILKRLGSRFQLQQDDKDLREVISEVRKLHYMKMEHRREYDWRVLLALLNLKPYGTGVREGRP